MNTLRHTRAHALRFHKLFQTSLPPLLCLSLAACGGGGGAVADAAGAKASTFQSFTPSYGVSGSVTGLDFIGSTLVLQNNGATPYSMTWDDDFLFVSNTPNYNVTVLKQPTPGQCTVTNGSGTLPSANSWMANPVAVTCGVSIYTWMTSYHQLRGVAADNSGNVYFASDTGLILKMDANETLSTLAVINSPRGIAVDPGGNVYFTNAMDSVISKISPNRTVTVVASASFNKPTDLAVDAAGNVYVADTGNHLISKIAPNGMVSTLAGRPRVGGGQDGPALGGATFLSPQGVAVDGNGTVYVADTGNNSIRKIANGQVSTFVMGLPSPHSIATDANGNVYVTDLNKVITKISPDGIESSFAGSGQLGSADGPAASAQFSNSLNGIAVDARGDVFVADSTRLRATRAATKSQTRQ